MAVKPSSENFLWKNRTRFRASREIGVGERTWRGQDRGRSKDAGQQAFSLRRFGNRKASAAVARPRVDLWPHLGVHCRTPALPLRLPGPKPARHFLNCALGPHRRRRGGSRLSRDAAQERYHGFPESRHRNRHRNRWGLRGVHRGDGLDCLACAERKIGPPAAFWAAVWPTGLERPIRHLTSIQDIAKKV